MTPENREGNCRGWANASEHARLPQAMPGNRTSITTSTGTADYIYPANSHRSSVDGEARSYDAAGNTTSVGSRAFSYNDANGVHRVKRSSVLVESCGYNHRGERVLRIPVAGELQITLYDEAGQWIGNYGGDGQAQQQAIWLDNYPIAVMRAPSAGVPDLAYIQPDHLGTPRVVIDPLWDVAIWNWSSQSEAFGNQGRQMTPMVMARPLIYRCGSQGSRPRLPAACSMTISGSTTL